MEFKTISEMPDDMAEAFDALKLSILRQKLDGWRDISRGDTMFTLGILVELVMREAADILRIAGERQ